MAIDAILSTIDGSKRDQGGVSYITRARIADNSLKSPRAPCVIFTDIEEVGWRYRTHWDAQRVSQRTKMSSSAHAVIKTSETPSGLFKPAIIKYVKALGCSEKEEKHSHPQESL